MAKTNDSAARAAKAEADLRSAGEMDDEALDIVALALSFALLDAPDQELDGYEAHLAELVAATGDTLNQTRTRDGASADDVAMALANVIAGRFSYHGDTETYDDLKNANLMAVIDRRQGLPVSLGILYLHVARSLGFDMAGLNFPGHFVLRLQTGTQATIIDPFNQGQTLNTADLLNLLRSIEGPDARLTPEVYAPVSTRDILLRLQNNILSRALRAGELDRARDVVNRMIWLAPTRAGLQFELGRLEVHAGHMGAAAQAFETCRTMAAGEGEMRVAGLAEEALRRLKTKLN